MAQRSPPSSLAHSPPVVLPISRLQDGRVSLGGENPARILLGGDGWFLVNTLLWAGVVGYAVFFAG